MKAQRFDLSPHFPYTYEVNSNRKMWKTFQGPDTSRATPVVSIIGYSGSGKTTLLEKLIRELKQRGYQLAVIKHHHHRGLRLDEPGKDTWRFARAGADHVVLAGPDRVAHLQTFAEEPPLEELVSHIRDVDIVLTEGYKHANTPKIEISRGKPEPLLTAVSDDLVAIASDRVFDLAVPQFGLEDVHQLADFIEARFLKSSQ